MKPLDWKVLYWGVLYSPCCLWWWPGLVFIAHLGVDSPGPWKAGKKRVGEGWSMLGEEARHNRPLTVGCWGSWTGGLGCCWPLWKQSGSFYWSWLDFTYSVVQSLNHVLLFASPWTAAHQASLSFTISHSLFKLVSIELVMLFKHLSHPLSPPSPPALSLSQHQGLFLWVDSLHQVAKVLELPLVAQMVKNPPAVQETRVQSLDQEDPLKEGMATHSSILAWKIPWTEKPDWL